VWRRRGHGRVGVRRRGLDGQGELLAGQRGGRLAASLLDPLRSTARTWTSATAREACQSGELVVIDGWYNPLLVQSW